MNNSTFQSIINPRDTLQAPKVLKNFLAEANERIIRGPILLASESLLFNTKYFG